VQELATRLEDLCKAKGVEKFSADEIVELLEDGEEVEWIVGQVLPEAAEAERGELRQLLAEIASEVAPPPVEDEDEVEAEETAESDESLQEVGEDLVEEELDLAELQGMLPPGVDMQQVEQMLSSPRGALLGDFGAFCQERGVEPEMSDAQMSDEMQELHEEWLQTPRDSLEGKKPAEMLEGGRLFPGKIETFRREAPKVGRNDPCPCGSGKKFKKCCGKGG
jgi:preprotein translocase subunit SecA